jgi:hypothetical protein
MTSPHDPGSPADRPDRDPAIGSGEPTPTDTRDLTAADDAPVAASAPTDRPGPDTGGSRPFDAAEPTLSDVPYAPDDRAPTPAFASGGDLGAADRWDRQDAPSPFTPGPSSFPAGSDPDFAPAPPSGATSDRGDPSATTAIPASEWAPPSTSRSESHPSDHRSSAGPADHAQGDDLRTTATPTGGSAGGLPSSADTGFASSADTTATSAYPAMTVAGLAGTADDQQRYGRSGYAPPAEPMVVPARVDPDAPQPSSRRDVGGRTVAGLISAVLGLLLVGGGLYLVGEFGSRIAVRMLDEGITAGVWDVVLSSVGAALVLGAVVLNGWSPWATLLPGVVLTGAGIWSLVAYDGADRIAGFLNRIFSEERLIGWGVTGWLLVLGVALLGASFAAMIARAAGRTRGRP